MYILLLSTVLAVANASLTCDHVLNSDEARAAQAQVARIYEAAPDDDAAVAVLGISAGELLQLLNTGAVEAGAAKLRPRFITGRADLEAFRAQNRRYEYDDGDAEDQWRSARGDAWARTVANVLQARYAGADLTSDRFLHFVRLLDTGLKGGESYSPKFRKVREAAEASDLAKAKASGARWSPRLRTLSESFGWPWVGQNQDQAPLERAVMATFANLPVDAGVVLALGPGALAKITWSERFAPFVKRVDVTDVVSIRPLSDAERRLLGELRERRD